MTKSSSARAMGRPREFDPPAALDAAVAVFWRSGYAATSLDDLTAAMGLSRSSFYSAFGSKHDVLLAAVGQYVDGIFARLQVLAAKNRDPRAALRAIFREVATPHGGGNGCLLVNSVAELAPGDAEIRDIARSHITRLLSLVSALLVQVGHRRGTADLLAGTLLSCVFGTMTMSRAGLPAARVAGFTKQAERLLSLPP